VGGAASRSTVRIHSERVDPRLTTDIESPIGKLDGYSLADLTTGRITLSAGVRYDVVRVPFRNRIDPSRDTTSHFRQLSPRGGVTIDLGRSAALFASVGQSFRPPAVIELACADPNEPCPLPFALGDDPPLDPVVATSYEMGARWTSDAVQLHGSWYRTDVRDDIYLFPYRDDEEPTGSTIEGYFANLAATRREGIEVDATFRLGRLVLYGSHAITRATFQVDGVEIFSVREHSGGENEVATGDRLPLVPGRVSSVGASLSLPHRASLGLDGRYTGSRFLRGDEANEEAPLPGYWVVDSRAGIHAGVWEVQLIARNLLDARHPTFGTFNINQGAGDMLERFLTPGAPRTIQLAIRRRFGPTVRR
jgi:outer membrane receptor protein involved in Fe transport